MDLNIKLFVPTFVEKQTSFKIFVLPLKYLFENRKSNFRIFKACIRIHLFLKLIVS